MPSPAPGTEGARVRLVGCARTHAGGVRALEATSLDIAPGEVLALLGPSGCGKTTLLRLVAGLLAPDAGGQVLFDDEDVTALPVERRDIGMVFQHYALFPQMSVAANIGYGLRVRGADAAQVRGRVGELVEMMRLQGLEQRRPAALSGGQKQRVALARAVAVRPRVLLLDEPLAALDAQLKESLREDLAHWLRQWRITTVHVTHDQREALAVADRLAVMRAGQVLQVGSGETLYRTPAHAFVAEFLGRVNRLARSPADRDTGTLRLGGAELTVPGETAGSTTLLLRPEDIVIVEPEIGVPCGVVRHRTFLGDRVQLRVALEDQAELLVDQRRDVKARPGDRVGLQIDTRHLMPAPPEDTP
ncbi:MAG: hypothetical protein RLZ83_509 [Pseudomonadota bacterium]